MTSLSSERRPGNPVQLLLVDDDASLGRLIAEYASFDGYVVQSVQTGTAGLIQVKNRSFALMILDVMLPDMDGFEVLRRLRLFSDIPVLMLTTRGEASDRVRGLASGADDYLPKPFEPDELFARINAVLRRIRPAMHGLRFVAIGDLELDERSRRVARRGEAIKLTGAEFSLLQIPIIDGSSFSSLAWVTSRPQLRKQG